MAGKTVLPHGTWPSPIRPENIASDKRLEDIQWSDGNSRIWLEGRSGAGTLVYRAGDDAQRDLTVLHNVRGGVGYGGGDFFAARNFAVFAEKNGRLYRIPLGQGDGLPITPEFGNAASPCVSPDGRWVIYVHSYEKNDRIAMVDSDGRLWPAILCEGADFYMQPVWHPSGEAIAWVEWNHPRMPWDGTLLKTGRITGAPPILTEVKVLAGGESVPVFQPVFSPDGRWLAFIACEEEWDSLYLMEYGNGKRSIRVREAVLTDPAWNQGLRTIGWSPDSRRVYYRRNDRGIASLCSLEVAGGKSEKLELGPYTWIRQLSVSPEGDKLAFLGSSPSIPERAIVWEAGKLKIEARSSAERVAAEDHSTPGLISWKSPEGREIHGIYYPPFHPLYKGGDLPPAIVNIHGGPTGQRAMNYSSDAAFFTSRGYGYLEVNYRGSTGYGRAYRLALNGLWGELDVEDAVGGAQELCRRGLADPARLVIKGASAGGFTVLNALIRHPGRFRAGVCLFGVSNLFTLASATHKFEERYLDSLVGTLPEAAEKYRQRSAVFHAESIRDPLAIFQGEEDKVVPPDQMAGIAEELRRRNCPHLYRLYPGEGHGWRKAETIADYYQKMEEFLRQNVLRS